MATETLDRLAAIIDGLAPLGSAGPGEPVVAAEWNTLVGAVQELARIAVARERTAEELLAASFAKADHGHDGAVNLTWFDPDTRSMIEGGRAQRADLAADLQRTQRDIADVRAAVEGLRTEIQAVKGQLDDIDDRDRDRARSVDRLSVRVEGFNDNATSIADVRSTLGEMDRRVGEALAFRNELVDEAGQPIDLAALRSDVGELLKIRENLTSADGRLVEYRDFERRLVAVEDQVADVPGTPGGEGPGIDLDDLRAEILDAAAARLDPRVAAVESRIGELDSAVQGIDPRVAAAQEALTAQGAQINALQTSTAGLPALVARVGSVESRVAGHDARFSALEPLPDRVSSAETLLQVLPELEARVAVTESDVAATRDSLARFDELDARIATMEERDLGAFENRLGAIEAEVESTREGVAVSDERLVVLESRADDLARRFADVETLGKANRETLTLLARDVDDIRRTGTAPTQPRVEPARPGSPVFERPGGPVVERPGGRIQPQ